MSTWSLFCACVLIDALAVNRRTSHAPSERCERRGDLLDRQHARAGDGANRRRRHRCALGSVRGLNERESATIGDPLQSARPVGVRAGEHNPHRPIAIGIRRRKERDVDRRPAVVHGFIRRQREESAVDEQMIIGGRDVHVAGPDRRLVLHLADTQRRAILKQSRQHLSRLSVAMLHGDDGNGEIARQTGNQLVQCGQTAPRCPDNNDLARHGYFTFRYSFSRGCKSS
jgi:hypothetical protein